MDQPSLFPVPERAYARSTDPVTSHMAAAGIDVTKSQEIVLIALKIGGPMTDEETYDYIRRTWPDVHMTEQSVRSRRAELRDRHHLVEDTGEYGRTKNGGKTKIWRAV